MKRFFALLIYTATMLGSSPIMADTAKVAMLREGDMRKLVFHEVPIAISDRPFQRETPNETGRLQEYHGQYVLLNFWATWCAPCRKEMPMLSELQKEFGGDDFQVVTIATGRNTQQGIKKFFENTKISNLPRFQDPKQNLSAQMGVFGLPVSILINPEGKEIARLRGDADWASESAKAIIRALINQK